MYGIVFIVNIVQLINQEGIVEFVKFKQEASTGGILYAARNYSIAYCLRSSVDLKTEFLLLPPVWNDMQLRLRTICIAILNQLVYIFACPK